MAFLGRWLDLESSFVWDRLLWACLSWETRAGRVQPNRPCFETSPRPWLDARVFLGDTWGGQFLTDLEATGFPQVNVRSNGAICMKIGGFSSPSPPVRDRTRQSSQWQNPWSSGVNGVPLLQLSPLSSQFQHP